MAMADLLHCDLVDVGGRMYRVYGGAGASQQRGQHPEYDEEDEGYLRSQPNLDDEEGDDDSSIVQEGGQWVCRVDLDAELLPFIIGKKGATKQRIEGDTGARLLIPRKDAQQTAGSGGSTSTQILIKGDSSGSVSRAKTQTELVVQSVLSGNRLEYNYFLSLPLATDSTRAAMEAFKQKVLGAPGAAAAGIEDSIFMKAAHLHLTLCMLKLYSEERRELAQQVLRSLKPEVQQLLQGKPLQVQLRGLEYMNDDPSQMHVMYLGVKDPPGQAGALQRLRQLCSSVVGAFSDAGLLLPQDDREVKLHATVINTRYRRRQQQQSGPPGFPLQQGPGQGQVGQGRPSPPRFERQPFDGRLLLDEFGDVDFGVVELPAVHLSQRGKYGADGFYHCADSLPLKPE